MARSRNFLVLCACALILSSLAVEAEPAAADALAQNLKTLVQTPAIPGYESALAAEIRSRLQAFSPETDSLGDVIITVGHGKPHRLIVAPMDEPGYVVSNITKNGYLRLQRLPQFGVLPLFNELYSAQPVGIQTASGKWINGVVAGLSVHLLPGRTHPPDPRDIANMYVDLGATTAAEALNAGVRVLDPVVIDRTLYELGGGRLAAAAVGNRFGDAALLEVLDHLNPSRLTGTLTVAFVAQQWTGARGLERVLERFKPDELVDVGRLLPGGGGFFPPRPARFPTRLPGSGVLAGVRDASAPLTGLAADFEQIAARHGIPFSEDYSAPLMPPSYLPAPPLPARRVHLAIAVAWPSTPAETIDSDDLGELVVLMEDYLQGSAVKPVFPQAHELSAPALPARPQTAPSPETIVKDLVETYGVSGHEGSVREAIERLLPAWAKPHTDDAGNLVLHLATGPASAPRILVIAHMDEIGFEVQSILPDGRLAVRWRGGGLPYFYLGHACLVHTAQGIRPGVMELPQGWNQRGFKWPRRRGMLYRVDVGAQNAAEVQALGIATGDFITIPKKYRRLADSRADARSFDDRVGDSALIAAVWALGGNLKGRNITFAWSTGEELGLVGASKMAARRAAQREAPNYVFAVDTFVSSDSPLESKRFADAPLGKGFVVRAIDNSNIVPANLVKKVLRIARANGIPVQYGITGGGNDGSAFLKYGAIDVALGWPLRYSHSPGEVIDTRDLDALARAVAAIARSW